MKSKLKVGDSFEVVEVLKGVNDCYNVEVFKIGGHTIYTGHNSQCICNNGYVGITYEGYSTLAILDSYRKPIGKLTITKVK